jgi:SulP family sulfate permease
MYQGTIKTWLGPALSGVLLGTIGVSIISAYATLLFRGNAAPYAVLGMACILIGNMLATLVVARRSQQQGVVVGPDESSVIILSGLVGSLPVLADPAAQAGMVMAHLVAACLGCGLMFWLVGRYRLGQIVRFIPYPVINGFLFGSGVLLFLAGVGQVAGQSVSLQSWPLWHGFAEHWLAILMAGGLAAALFWVPPRVSSALAFPALILLAVIFFFMVSSLQGIDHAQLVSQGYLTPLGDHAPSLWSLSFASLWAGVDGDVLWRSAPTVLVVAAVALLTALLQIVALEQVLGEDVDENRELRTYGVANLLAGVFGAFPTVSFIGDTLLNRQVAGAQARAATYVLAVILLAGVWFADVLLAYMPIFVMAALLLFFGICLIVDSLEKARKAASSLDLIITLFVGLVVNLGGFVEGAMAGIVITSLIFLVKYSKIDFVKQQFSNHTVPSRVTRSGDGKRLLQASDWLSVYVLEGFLFFGSAQRLYERVREDYRVARPEQCIIDFRHVKGVDATAVSMLGKVAGMVAAQGGVLVFSGVHRSLLRSLLVLRSESVRFTANLDLAVQFAEDRHLARLVRAQQDQALFPFLADIAPYAQARCFESGSVVIRQGSGAVGLLLVMSGSVSVRVELPDGQQLRLRKFMCGTILGEISLYTGAGTVANVYANERTDVLLLSPEQLASIEQHQPGLAITLHKAVAAVMAHRLVDTNRSLQQATL